MKNILILSVVILSSSCGMNEDGNGSIQDMYYLMALYESQVDEAIQSTVLLTAIDQELEIGALLSDIYEVEKDKIRMALVSAGRAVQLYKDANYTLTKQMVQMIEVKSPITKLSMQKLRDEYQEVWYNGNSEEIRMIRIGFEVYCMYGNPYSYRTE